MNVRGVTDIWDPKGDRCSGKDTPLRVLKVSQQTHHLFPPTSKHVQLRCVETSCLSAYWWPITYRSSLALSAWRLIFYLIIIMTCVVHIWRSNQLLKSAIFGRSCSMIITPSRATYYYCTAICIVLPWTFHSSFILYPILTHNKNTKILPRDFYYDDSRRLLLFNPSHLLSVLSKCMDFFDKIFQIYHLNVFYIIMIEI